MKPKLTKEQQKYYDVLVDQIRSCLDFNWSLDTSSYLMGRMELMIENLIESLLEK